MYSRYIGLETLIKPSPYKLCIRLELRTPIGRSRLVTFLIMLSRRCKPENQFHGIGWGKEQLDIDCFRVNGQSLRRVTGLEQITPTKIQYAWSLTYRAARAMSRIKIFCFYSSSAKNADKSGHLRARRESLVRNANDAIIQRHKLDNTFQNRGSFTLHRTITRKLIDSL